MNMKLADDNRSDLLLDSKALKAIIDAVGSQLERWQATRPDERDEDAFADLQNDIGYLQILLHNLEDTYQRRYGSDTG